MEETILLIMDGEKQYALDFNAKMSKYRALFLKEFFSDKNIKSILDLGAGTGDVIFELNKISNLIRRAKKVAFVDFNRKYLNQIQKKFNNKKFEFILSSVEKLKLNQKYDLVIAIDILEHLQNPLVFLKKAKKLIASRGYIIIIVPNAKSIHRLVGKEAGFIKRLYELGRGDMKVGHRRYFDSKKLRSLINKAGFKEVNCSGILLKPIPNAAMRKLDSPYVDFLYEIGKKIPDYCAELALVSKI